MLSLHPHCLNLEKSATLPTPSNVFILEIFCSLYNQYYFSNSTNHINHIALQYLENSPHVVVCAQRIGLGVCLLWPSEQSQAASLASLLFVAPHHHDVSGSTSHPNLKPTPYASLYLGKEEKNINLIHKHLGTIPHIKNTCYTLCFWLKRL
jgi:hypothetical protein